jgi:hypothetical protein
LGASAFYDIFKIYFVLHFCRFEQNFATCVAACEKYVQALVLQAIFRICDVVVGAESIAHFLRGAESIAQNKTPAQGRGLSRHEVGNCCGQTMTAGARRRQNL